MKISALVGAITAAVAMTVPFAPMPTPGPVVIPRAGSWTVSSATVPGMVTISQAPTPLNVGQAQHSAFPGLAKLPDGRLRLVWRQGSDHYAARNGVIMRATSEDGGQSYLDPLALRAGGDYRDPSVSIINGAEYMTWFTGTNTAPAQGAWMMREWGAATRFDGGLPYAATAAPLVKLPNGQIGGAFYGRKSGELIDTVWMAWANGATWNTNRIVNNIGAGLAHNEPWLTVDGTLTHLFFRWGNTDSIAVRTSTNSGLPLASGASGWSDIRKVLTNATGRPTTVLAADGTLVMVYRELSTGAARIAYSTDHAQTFQLGPVLLASQGGLGMTYAAMVATGTEIIGVLGMEQGDGISSKLYGFRLDTTP